MDRELIPVLDLLQRNALTVLAAAVLGAVVTYALSFMMAPAYRAETLLVPVGDDAQASLLATLGGQLGGLGGLVGAGWGTDSRASERMATLTSKTLANQFIDDRSLVELFCKADAIRCAPSRPNGVSPIEGEANQALKLFTRRVLAVSEDKRTGLVRVSITWFDRHQAAEWANEYVELANKELQHRAISESQSRVEFLRDAAEKAQTVELRAATYRLMESEVKSVMVAATRPDFAFRVIDRALVPDETARVRPKRSLLALAGGSVGIIFALAVLLARARRRMGHANEGAPLSGSG